MNWLLAIDPGPTESAWVELRDGRPVAFAKEPNAVVLDRIGDSLAPVLAMEMIESYGMAVGKEVFSTVVWSGRLIQRWLDENQQPADSDRVMRVSRKDVRMHLCHSMRAGDPNVRQALIDLYGPEKAAAIGLKKTPGPLYGVTGDVWAALAVGVTVTDQLAVREQMTMSGREA